MSDDATYIAAIHGRFDLLQELVSRGHPWTALNLHKVVASRQVDVLAFLLDRYGHAQGREHSCHPLCVALGTSNKNLDSVRLLWDAWSQRPCSECDDQFLKADCTRLEIVKFLWQRGCRKGADKAMEIAAAWGAMDTIDFLRDQGCPWPRDTMAIAAGHNLPGTMEKLNERGCPWGQDVMKRAIRYGHLECVKYAHRAGWPMYEDALILAVRDSYGIDIVRYLHANGCPWTSRVCATMVRECWEGSETHRYALDHGCAHELGRCELRRDDTKPDRYCLVS